jgi:hypothetical protein
MAAQGYRKKSNTSMKKESNGALPLRRSVRPQFVHDVSGSVISASTSSVQQRHMVPRTSACENSSDYGIMCHDPQRVKEWQFTSAQVSAPFLDNHQAELVNTNFGDGAYNESNNDLAVDFAAFQFTGQYGVPDGPMPTSNNVYNIRGGNAMTYTDESALIPDAQFMEDASLDNDFWLPTDTQEAGSQPTSVDMVYTTSADSYYPGSSDYFEDSQVQPYWTASGTKPIDCQPAFRSREADWSPPSACTNDLSVSSSYSQGSSMYPHASSPEFAILEDLGSVPPLAEFSQPGIPITGGSHHYSYDLNTSRFVISTKSLLQV